MTHTSVLWFFALAIADRSDSGLLRRMVFCNKRSESKGVRNRGRRRWVRSAWVGARRGRRGRRRGGLRAWGVETSEGGIKLAGEEELKRRDAADVVVEGLGEGIEGDIVVKRAAARRGGAGCA